jgi:hypothetical protein
MHSSILEGQMNTGFSLGSGEKDEIALQAGGHPAI